MKKILFVGVFQPGSTNISQANAFEDNGCFVYRYDYRHQKEVCGDRADDILIEFNKAMDFDMVFFSKCNGMDPRVNKEVAKESRSVLWYMDPLNGNFNQEFIDKIPVSDHCFFALKTPYWEAQKYGSPEKIHFIHEGFDPYIDRPIPIEKFEHDVSFIGSLRGKREEYFTEIGFDNIQDAYGDAHPLAVSRSKINLNFVDSGSGCSDRVYKVLAAGGFLLTEMWPELGNDFVPKKDLVVFVNTTDLRAKIKYYLEHEDKRMEIALNGLMAVQKYSRTIWAKNILEKVFG